MNQARGLPGAAGGEIRAWHPLEQMLDDPTFLQELAVVIKHSASGVTLSPSQLQLRTGELRSLIKAAQRGELTDGTWTPVMRHPDLWELRIRWDDDDTLVRIYFHEPASAPTQTVAALAHVKLVVPGDPARTTQIQNAYMQQAQDRLTSAWHVSWGLRWSQPIFPEPQAGLPPQI